MDAKELKDLLRFVRDAGFFEFELEQEGLRLRVVKAPAAGNPGSSPTVFAQTVPAVLDPSMLPHAAVLAAEPAGPAAGATPLDPSLHDQTSPMVGTFYSAPRPGAPPFANVGDRVSPGQTLCIIEAMKLMNEIEAEVAGILVEIVPQNAQPVEYGEVLFRIRKD